MKEFLKYFICYIGTFGGILALAMWALLLYGMHSTAQAGTIKYKTVNHYDTADELFTQLEIEAHVVKHTHVDAIDQKEPCIDISAIEQAKIIIAQVK